MEKGLKQLSDEDLMAHYQLGEVAAFEVLFARHSGKVLGFLQKKTSADSARDLLQETFLKVHRSRHQYSPKYPFLPWLFTISRNALVDHIRLNETRVSKASTAGLDIPQEVLATPDLSYALEALPANQKRAIELRYLSEWTFEQIAIDMKTSPVNVRQILSRGLKKLRGLAGGHHE